MIFSPTGGTRKVADVITKHWNFAVETDFSQYIFKMENVILIALPSYGGLVPGNQANCILVCVYGNRVYGDTLVEMKDVARESSFEIVAAISAIAEHSVMHQYAAGRPEAEDLSQLEAFASLIKEKLDSSQKFGEIHLLGKHPYKRQVVLD